MFTANYTTYMIRKKIILNQATSLYKLQNCRDLYFRYIIFVQVIFYNIDQKVHNIYIYDYLGNYTNLCYKFI